MKVWNIVNSDSAQCLAFHVRAFAVDALPVIQFPLKLCLLAGIGLTCYFSLQYRSVGLVGIPELLIINDRTGEISDLDSDCCACDITRIPYDCNCLCNRFGL